MDKYLPVGTILSVRDIEVMVIGYSSQIKDNQIIDGYMVVKHPIGFQGDENLGFLALNEDYKMVFEGYVYEEATEYLEAQKNLMDELKKYPASEAEKQLAVVGQNLLKGAGE